MAEESPLKIYKAELQNLSKRRLEIEGLIEDAEISEVLKRCVVENVYAFWRLSMNHPSDLPAFYTDQYFIKLGDAEQERKKLETSTSTLMCGTHRPLYIVRHYVEASAFRNMYKKIV